MDEREQVYSVAHIREAFARHASTDDWGFRNFTEDRLLAALRGALDEPVASCSCGAVEYGPLARHFASCPAVLASTPTDEQDRDHG